MQGTRAGVDELTEDLFSLLTYLVKDADVEVFRVAADLDLSLSQIRCLFVLSHADRELALSALATEMGLSVAATGRAVDVLVRHGLVVRHEDADDRRVKRIGLTAAGMEKILDLSAARREGLHKFLATLSDTERDGLSAALAPILARPDVHDFLQELPH